MSIVTVAMGQFMLDILDIFAENEQVSHRLGHRLHILTAKLTTMHN
jgi:hypothetical protein